MQRGTVAWMKAWPANDKEATAGASGSVLEKEDSGVAVDIPGAPCREAIWILVDMIVKRCQEDVA
jgi:hypothetical protein